LAKNKLKKYSEVGGFPNVLQPSITELDADHKFKGSWAQGYFKNDNPIVLELGCGKGEYTINLARVNSNCNFIGIDIKGARLWFGSSMAIEEQLRNVSFLRMDVGYINRVFDSNEISEIWVTFPDPQPKKKQIKKRLTNPIFLKKYSTVLRKDGIVHLKTDNQGLFEYTIETIQKECHQLLMATYDLYGGKKQTGVLGVKTYYEGKFLEKGIPICYLKFKLRD
jgi:tRNA (guanine-N7-)-methyltransferase